MKRTLLILFGVPGLLLTGLLLYWGSLLFFFGYELTSSEGAMERLVEQAVAARDPSICNRFIHPQIMMGPARYEFVNGCEYEYAAATGDISVCMGTMGPDSCVQRIAQERNQPELCAQAIDPRRQGTDGRGTCFGYFAGKERDYGHCERLPKLENMNEAQQRICFNAYMDKTGDLELCFKVNNLFPEYEPKEWADACYFSTAYATNKAEFCNHIQDSEIRSRCKSRFDEK